MAVLESPDEGEEGMTGLDPISLIALAAVTLVGLPHGAMDAAVALALGYGRNPGRLAGFIGLYLLLAALVIGFWMLAPILALGLFLLISLVHFGLGDTDREDRWPRYIQMACHGGIVTIAIPLAHRGEVTTLFEMISGPHALLWPVLETGAVLCLGAGLAYAVLAFRDRSLRKGFAEWLGLAVLVTLLPPLVGFAFYFTLVHTPRHILRITTALRASQPHLPVWGMTAGFTLATWAMAGAAFLMLKGQIGMDAASLRIVFIGLAALTVPHMILIDGIFRPGMKSV